MRTYLIDHNKKEMIIDLVKTIKHSSNLIEFEYIALENQKVMDSKRFFIRRLARNYFSSIDGVKWQKLARQYRPSKILNVDRVFDIYRGYKPSGLSALSEGELLTQMPGKVVKLNVKAGDRVKKGDTLLVLEAMKMENEIKTSLDGWVKNIHCKEGEALECGFLMIELVSKEDEVGTSK